MQYITYNPLLLRVKNHCIIISQPVNYYYGYFIYTLQNHLGSCIHNENYGYNYYYYNGEVLPINIRLVYQFTPFVS